MVVAREQHVRIGAETASRMTEIVEMLKMRGLSSLPRRFMNHWPPGRVSGTRASADLSSVLACAIATMKGELK